MKPWNCTSEKSGKAPHPPVQETRLATPSGILYETILNSVDFGILAADTRGMVIFVNPFARSLLDFQEDISNHDVHIDAIDKDLWEEYRKIIETGKPQVNVPADANGKPLVSHRLPVRLNGRIVGAMSVFKLLETYEELANDIFKLKEYAHEIEAIIESSYDGIYVTDGEANTLRVNSAYEKITGIKASEVIGRNMNDLVKEGYFDESASLRVREEKKPVTLRQTLKSGKSVLVR
jgi:transcriptional regulator with PAS, ATPase and Fis domain